MKITNRLVSLSLATAALLAASSCENSDIEFPDFEYTTVYFANQNPVRTLVMGEDFDANTDYDNKHMCRIGTTFGGSYTGKNIKVEVEVDNSLCNNIYYDDAFTIPIKPMPTDYYTLSSTTMDFDGGFVGYIDVTFTDKFFEDPLNAAVFADALSDKPTYDYSNGYYVIPLKIKSQTGADSILSGSYDHDKYPNGVDRTNKDAWSVAPQDYTLYAVNYINKYSGYWLESGKDVVNGTTVSREVENKYTIDDKVVHLATLSLNKLLAKTPDYTYDPAQPAESLDIVLDFKDDGSCTVSAPEGASYTVSGSGQYTKGGAGKYWGDQDRDLITLKYTVKSGANTYETTDQLVSQRRGIRYTEFTVNYKSAK